MAKNPWMSAYLSAANKMANAARGQMMGAAKAEQKKTQKNMMDAWFDMFTPGRQVDRLEEASREEDSGQETRRQETSGQEDRRQANERQEVDHTAKLRSLGFCHRRRWEAPWRKPILSSWGASTSPSTGSWRQLLPAY